VQLARRGLAGAHDVAPLVPRLTPRLGKYAT
jgi:hypothetical protein